MKSNKMDQGSSFIHFLSILLVIDIWMGSSLYRTDAHFFNTCPKACICQNKQAHCDAMSLTRMPSPLPLHLEALLMRNNLVRKVNHRHLGKLRSLKHLILKGNRINKIEPDSFKNLRNLVSLSLTENKIRKLAPETFRTLGELRFLSLRENRISTIEGLFSRLYKLQLLNAASNRIRKISHKTFRHNWRLIVLDLHNNNIRFIHKHAFRMMPLIKYLVLRDNPLGTLEVNFKPNIHLELMDFTNCKLSEVVQGLPYSINDLRLSENNITKITAKDFQNTRKIRLLVLNSNQINEIDDNAFSRMFQLYDLYLSSNSIEKLPLKLPRSMHGIYANSNNLTHIQFGSLNRIHTLEYLYVRNNNINNIDKEALWSLGNLRSLDISENNIGDLKAMTFRGNKHLQRLDISRNPLLQLDSDSFLGLDNLHIFEMSSVGSPYDKPRINPMIFKDLKKLLFLDLSNSSHVAQGIAENPRSLEHVSSVEDLNLMEDQLFGLPSNFASHFHNLRVIKLIGNPWHCNMEILWLSHWMRNNTVEFFAPYHMICATPPELKGRLIIELTESDLMPVTRRKPFIKFIEISLKEYTELNGTDGTMDITKNPYQYSGNFSNGIISLDDLIDKTNQNRVTKASSHKFYSNQDIFGNNVNTDSRNTLARNMKTTFMQSFKTIAPSFFDDYKTTQKQSNQETKLMPKGRHSDDKPARKDKTNFTKWREKSGTWQRMETQEEGSGNAVSEEYMIKGP